MNAPAATLPAQHRNSVLYAELDPTVHVSPFCLIETGDIGKHTILGPYTHVMKNSRIGAHCRIEGCYIQGAKIGDSVSVWRNAHLMFDAEIGDGTLIGHGCFIADGSCVGKDCRLMLNVGIGRITTIGDGVYIGPNVVLANSNQDGALKPVLVGNNAWIGTNAVTTAGVNIGNDAVVGAGAVVTKDVEPYTIVVGNPARVVGDVRIGK